MRFRLEKLVDGEWYTWGTYDFSDKYDLIAFGDACSELAKHFEIRIIKVEE